MTILGTSSFGGTYVLCMAVTQDVPVRFGRFQAGQPLFIPAGEMIYLGSAMRGLASRVLRHCLRTGEKPAHALYRPLLAEMQKAEMVTGRFHPPAQKKLHWHIDYLLDETAVTLTHVLLIRSEERLEEKLGAWLLTQPQTTVLVPGLGASDVKRHTHILKIKSDGEKLWERLCHINVTG